MNRLLIENMLDDILETEDFDKLLNNENVLKCPSCNFSAATIGGINYHIGRNHLGETKLFRRRPKGDKKYVTYFKNYLAYQYHIKL